MFISSWEIAEKYSVPQVAQYFKGSSSRELRRKYWDRVKIHLWGDSFWSDGYFYESVGRVTSESVEYYIKLQQGKHWADVDFYVHKKTPISEIFKGLFQKLTETTTNAQGFQP